MKPKPIDIIGLQSKLVQEGPISLSSVYNGAVIITKKGVLYEKVFTIDRSSGSRFVFCRM